MKSLSTNTGMTRVLICQVTLKETGEKQYIIASLVRVDLLTVAFSLLLVRCSVLISAAQSLLIDV